MPLAGEWWWGSMACRVGEAGECDVMSHWRKVMGKLTGGNGMGGGCSARREKAGAFMVEQRGHELVGRPRVASVLKVLVQSDVYRGSAMRFAYQVGRGTEWRKGHTTVGVFVAGSVVRLVDRWKKHQIRKR
ncbi:unnamed protein product [Ectocarpus sp. 13 AM-2016]